jgi:kinesin family protein C2/C3
MSVLSSSSSTNKPKNNGTGVVRIKPMGAGGGGGETSASTGHSSVEHCANTNSVRIETKQGNKGYNFAAVIQPETDNAAMFEQFMPPRIEGFLEGYNVNIMAYGQTGSGKTHTVFGPPGILSRAGSGEYGTDIHQDYGLFPRGIITIFRRVEELRQLNPGQTFVLTCAAVELGMMGNEDMFDKSGTNAVGGGQFSKMQIGGIAGGVALSNVTKPPSLYGMNQLILDNESDILKAFAALSVRNTEGTNMNDSSSRSHCFAWLNLYRYDNQDQVTTTRFQFCDLAGSERMKNAHGGFSYSTASENQLKGLMTNYSLMMLGQACVDIVAATKSGRKIQAFRAYKVDLIPLLSESLTGTAMTFIFVCLSQAPDNASQSVFAMDFGQKFSMLPFKHRKVQSRSIHELVQKAKKNLMDNKKALASTKADRMNKYSLLRAAIVRDCTTMLRVYDRFDSRTSTSGGSCGKSSST